jgi:hypothetical protein
MESEKAYCVHNRESGQDASANTQGSSSRADHFVSSISARCAGCSGAQHSTPGVLILSREQIPSTWKSPSGNA